jgi:hypothetical protein
MKSSASTSRAVALVALAAVLALAGCRSTAGISAEGEARRKALEHDLVGRWKGEAVDPPAEVWFTHAKFDVWFSDRGDFSAVASTYAGKPYDIHFEGTYEVRPAPGPASSDPTPFVTVDQRDLGGFWTFERRGPDDMVAHVLLLRGKSQSATADMRIALKKQFGS